MSELAKPFLRLWRYVDEVGGFPGQVFFVVAVVMLFIGVATWYANKR